MLPPSTSKINSANYELSRVQDNLSGVLDQVLALSFMKGVLFTGVVLDGTNPVQLTHGLGRIATKFLVFDSSGAARFFRNAADQAAATTTQIQLRADAATTAVIWVF